MVRTSVVARVAPSTTGPGRSAPPNDRRGRAALVVAILDEHVPAVAPFLLHGDAFQLLVAVVLSAQCTDARVNQVTPALFGRAPDAATMAQMKVGELRSYIRTSGLDESKAKNLIALSRELVARYHGAVPRALDALERLPGVGHKTASVVMAQAFGEPAFPIDTHIHRLAGRWQLSRARNVDEVERDLKAVFPRDRWATLHLQLIEFGRSHCTAKAHDPAGCPVCSWAMSKRRAVAERRQGSSKPASDPQAARRAVAARVAAAAARAEAAAARAEARRARSDATGGPATQVNEDTATAPRLHPVTPTRTIRTRLHITTSDLTPAVLSSAATARRPHVAVDCQLRFRYQM